MSDASSARPESASKKVPKNRQNNSQALAILSSWLTATGIAFKVRPETGIDLRVTKKDGTFLNVVVQVDLFAEAHPQTDVIVLVDEVLSLKRDDAFAAFFSITEPAGFGRPRPVYRGEDPKSPEGADIKTNDFDLLILRHREFRNAPDLSPEVLEQYRTIITMAAKAFHRRNLALCQRIQYGIDDLMSIATVWAHNHHHRYRKVDATESENRRDLAAHLKQRFLNALNQIQKRQASQFPDEETVNLCLTGDVHGHPDQEPLRTDDDHRAWLKSLTKDQRRKLSPFQKEILQRIQEQERVKAEERKKTAVALDDLLAKMPHDDRIERLTEVADNPHCAFEARRLAKQRLEEERRTCETCIAAHDARIDRLKNIVADPHATFDERRDARRRLDDERKTCATCKVAA